MFCFGEASLLALRWPCHPALQLSGLLYYTWCIFLGVFSWKSTKLEKRPLVGRNRSADSCWFWRVWWFFWFPSCVQSGKKKVRAEKEENVTLGPTVREGEHVFGVAHIFASFNDTFVVSIASSRAGWYSSLKWIELSPEMVYHVMLVSRSCLLWCRFPWPTWVKYKVQNYTRFGSGFSNACR